MRQFTKQINVRLTPEQLDQIAKLAQLDDRTVSNWVRLVIQAALTSTRKPPNKRPGAVLPPAGHPPLRAFRDKSS